MRNAIKWSASSKPPPCCNFCRLLQRQLLSLDVLCTCWTYKWEQLTDAHAHVHLPVCPLRHLTTVRKWQRKNFAAKPERQKDPSWRVRWDSTRLPLSPPVSYTLLGQTVGPDSRLENQTEYCLFSAQRSSRSQTRFLHFFHIFHFFHNDCNGGHSRKRLLFYLVRWAHFYPIVSPFCHLQSATLLVRHWTKGGKAAIGGIGAGSAEWRRPWFTVRSKTLSDPLAYLARSSHHLTLTCHQSVWGHHRIIVYLMWYYWYYPL